MDLAPLTSVLSNKKPVLFNFDGLNEQGVARIEASVKSAKETLKLADNLQSMRDVTRTLWKLQDSIKTTGLAGYRRKLLDISL